MEFITFSTAFWDDKYTRKLEKDLKLLYIHLFTNSLIENGFQEYDTERWAEKTGLTVEEVAAGVEQFVRDGKAIVEGETFYMRNAIKHLRLGGAGSKNLLGALNKVRTNWSSKAPRSVAECLRRYSPEPGPTPSDPVPAESGTSAQAAPDSYQRTGSPIRTEQNNTTEQTEQTTRKATTSRRSQAEERAKARAEKEAADLAELQALETKLPNDRARACWKDLKDGMAAENESGVQAPSVPLRLLKEFLSVIEDDKLSADAVVHGLEACLHPASGGVAGNKTYFRKASNGYKPPRGPIFEGSRGPGSGSPMTGRAISENYEDTEIEHEPET